MIKNKFLIVVTTAPSNYDGFGTFQINQDICNILGINYQDLTWTASSLDNFDLIFESKKNFRFVAINERHFDWQTMRYHSGLYLVTHSFWQVEISHGKE